MAANLPGTWVWYGAVRSDRFKFFYTSPGAHTMEIRGRPSSAKAVAKAITAFYEIPLPPIAEGLGRVKLPAMNVGMIGGGEVTNAVPREAWFTVDLRSLDSATQHSLESSLVSTARRIGEQEGVSFRMEKKMGIDYSKALPQKERLNHPFPQSGHAGDRSFGYRLHGRE